MRIIPLLNTAVSEEPRCDFVATGDANVAHARQWRVNRFTDRDPTLCRHKARYTVNGQRACKRHASLAALDHLLGVNKRISLEDLLVPGTQIRIGLEFSKMSWMNEGEVVTLIHGEFPTDDTVELATALWNPLEGGYDSIYHLFENDLSGFKDCEVVWHPFIELASIGRINL